MSTAHKAERRRKLTVPDICAARHNGRPLTMVTAYDFAFARLIDHSAIDMILVGDSGGMTTLGYETTLPVTMDEMLAMARAVTRGAPGTFRVGDLPFMSYEVSAERALDNAGRMLKEAGMDAVKLEGGRRMARTVETLVGANIPVVGHIGLTPQSLARLGGFRVQGRDLDAAEALVRDALALQDAGAFALVVEAVPAPVAAAITDVLSIPTIGIGAGGGCTGQVLVLHDLLGLFDRFRPRFVKQYANLGGAATEALNQFAADVVAGSFPAQEHTYAMSAEDEAALRERLCATGLIP